MTRIHVICEGQTEETFINSLLNPYFNVRGVYLYPSLIGKAGHKGGNVNAQRLFNDVKIRLKDTTAFCTTFFDFYALPSDFPGKLEANGQRTISDKARTIGQNLSLKLTEILEGDNQNNLRRFIPYVQMYEFEGLLFSDPVTFARGIYKPTLDSDFQAIRDQFSSPEEINDSSQTAPSKRIKNLMPGYEKPLYGSLAALEIGLDTILSECVLFRSWVQQLEALRPDAS